MSKSGNAWAVGDLMATTVFAPSDLDVMETLLQRLVRAFNHREAGGIDAVAAEIVSLGSWLRIHRGEAAGELVATWLEKQNHRVPLK